MNFASPTQHLESEQTMTTDWYPPQIKPVRVGIYESQIFDGGFIYDWFLIWDGRHWRDSTGMTLIDQNIIWRGLTEDALGEIVRTSEEIGGYEL